MVPPSVFCEIKHFNVKKMDITPQSVLLERVQPLMVTMGRHYKKTRHVLARRATRGEVIQTITDDGLETTNTVESDAFVVQNLTQSQEQYVLETAKFEQKYRFLDAKDEVWAEYAPLGEIHALELTDAVLEALNLPDECQFMASWGEPMMAKKGDFLVMPVDSEEVYRIARKEFFETYT
jgi:hypothetical protein